MIYKKIESYLKEKPRTLLCVGPMSVNCIDATIELANQYDIPLMLIASRRQIDSEDFGSGYVNNWSTEEFAKYVFKKDKKKKIYLARDHGGPWQNDLEKTNKLSLDKAMLSAKDSFKADIDSGFQVLHIDTSIDINKTPSIDEALNRLFELYEFCWSYSQKSRKDIVFEIGTEEQSGSTNSQDELDYVLKKINSFCKKNKILPPIFVVIQSGTRVMETRNIGSFDSPLRIANEIAPEIQIPKMIQICNKYGIFMKEHNADYLSDDALKWHPRLGIHAANVAPEFGVTETRALISLLETNNLNILAQNFLELSLQSFKWEKWIIKGSGLSDRDRSIISGHYVFSKQECQMIKMEAQKILKDKGIDLENELKNAVKKAIYRYIVNFRMLGK